MKKLILILSCVLLFTMVKSQHLHVVPYYNWSNKTTFMVSPSPIITGYGPLSDSLSKIHGCITFYEYNDEYYPINNWADYYFWYVNKYWYQFNEPDLYEYYYFTKDDYGMAQYICGANYYGKMYPSRIAISFPGKSVYINNLSPYCIKRCIKKNSWGNKYYMADRQNKPKQETRLVKRELNSKENVARNSSVVQNTRLKTSGHDKVDRTQLYKNSRTNSDDNSVNRYSNSSTRNNKIGNSRNNSSRVNNKNNSISVSNTSNRRKSSSSNSRSTSLKSVGSSRTTTSK